MIIDFHTHTFPDKMAAAAIAKMQLDCHSAAFTAGTVDALKDSQRSAGIDLSVVLPVATNPMKIGGINDISIALNDHDGLMYFGGVHPDAPNWREELERLSSAGIKGVKVHPVYQGADLDDRRYLRIFERCAELGLWVVSHGGDDIGFPGVRRCTPEMARNALKQVPGLKLVMAHMGGWRNWERVADCLADTDAYIDTSFSLGGITPLDDGFYDDKSTALLSEEEFCALVHAFGSKRVLFGSDSPWTSQCAGIKQIKALPLSDGEKADILGGNAERILLG